MERREQQQQRRALREQQESERRADEFHPPVFNFPSAATTAICRNDSLRRTAKEIRAALEYEKVDLAEMERREQQRGQEYGERSELDSTIFLSEEERREAFEFCNSQTQISEFQLAFQLPFEDFIECSQYRTTITSRLVSFNLNENDEAYNLCRAKTKGLLFAIYNLVRNQDINDGGLDSRYFHMIMIMMLEWYSKELKVEELQAKQMENYSLVNTLMHKRQNVSAAWYGSHIRFYYQRIDMHTLMQSESDTPSYTPIYLSVMETVLKDHLLSFTTVVKPPIFVLKEDNPNARLVFEYLGPHNYLSIALVCKGWKKLYKYNVQDHNGKPMKTTSIGRAYKSAFLMKEYLSKEKSGSNPTNFRWSALCEMADKSASNPNYRSKFWKMAVNLRSELREMAVKAASNGNMDILDCIYEHHRCCIMYDHPFSYTYYIKDIWDYDTFVRIWNHCLDNNGIGYSRVLDKLRNIAGESTEKLRCLHTFLKESIDHKNWDIVYYLSQSTNAVTSYSVEDMMTFAEEGNLDALKVFFEHRDDVSNFSNEVADEATEGRHLHILKWMTTNDHPWDKQECLDIAKTRLRDDPGFAVVVEWIEHELSL